MKLGVAEMTGWITNVHGGGGVSKKVEESRLRLNGHVMRRGFAGSMASGVEGHGESIKEGGRRGGVCLGIQCDSHIDLPISNEIDIRENGRSSNI